jgi:hypothetical protein
MQQKMSYAIHIKDVDLRFACPLTAFKVVIVGIQVEHISGICPDGSLEIRAAISSVDPLRFVRHSAISYPSLYLDARER